MSLTEFEKKEIIEDAKDMERMENFRKTKNMIKKISFEEYVAILEEIQSMCPKNPKEKQIINYKLLKI